MESVLVGLVGFLVMTAMALGGITEQVAALLAAGLVGYLMARFVDMLRSMAGG